MQNFDTIIIPYYYKTFPSIDLQFDMLMSEIIVSKSQNKGYCCRIGYTLHNHIHRNKCLVLLAKKLAHLV